MADKGFEHPRLAAIYDALDGDRSDLDVSAGIAKELGARRVLDVGSERARSLSSCQIEASRSSG
jgi:hypothetical protein